MVLKSNFQNPLRTIEKTWFYNPRGLARQYGLKHQLMRYDKGLGLHPPKRRRIIQNTTRKIQWLGMKDDVYKLQHYLNTHIGTINILLAEYQLDLLSLASEQASSNKLDIQSHLRATQDAIDAPLGI